MLALDPLLDDLTVGDVVIVLLKVVIVFVLGLVATMLMVWFERKAIAGMQNRIGPNKAGPWGILQTLADGSCADRRAGSGRGEGHPGSASIHLVAVR